MVVFACGQRINSSDELIMQKLVTHSCATIPLSGDASAAVFLIIDAFTLHKALELLQGADSYGHALAAVIVPL